MASIRPSARNPAAIMRFPCGHCEPDASFAKRIREVSGRAVWIACQACNVIALACAKPIDRRRRAGKGLTARTY